MSGKELLDSLENLHEAILNVEYQTCGIITGKKCDGCVFHGNKPVCIASILRRRIEEKLREVNDGDN